MSAFDQLVEQFGELKFDPEKAEKQRQRAKKSAMAGALGCIAHFAARVRIACC